MSASMTAPLVADAFVMRPARRGKPDALLHHSDQGSQYTSDQFQRLLGRAWRGLQYQPRGQHPGQRGDGSGGADKSAASARMEFEMQAQLA